jgi:hypothetical protein
MLEVGRPAAKAVSLSGVRDNTVGYLEVRRVVVKLTVFIEMFLCGKLLKRFIGDQDTREDKVFQNEGPM